MFFCSLAITKIQLFIEKLLFLPYYFGVGNFSCLNVGASTFKADLLFFHRGLQALVAVELKKTKFHPRDLGQLEFYLEALDRDVKRSNENPSIGIILCPDVDKVVVEYAMSRSMSPTMVAEYKRILIPQEKMQQQLREFCEFFLKEDRS